MSPSPTCLLLIDLLVASCGPHLSTRPIICALETFGGFVPCRYMKSEEMRYPLEKNAVPLGQMPLPACLLVHFSRSIFSSITRPSKSVNRPLL